VGTFLFVGGQRGFTLVEMVVAVGIVALLAVVVTLSLALRPGALRATVASFDASFAAARAIAATSGNGATIVVAPRSDARGRLPGFTLRIYRGRPTAENAVTLADVPAVIADADVREASFGSPPFAIFLSTAGNASGLSAYPTFASDGTPRFAPIASQPPCPSGGLVLTFASAHASQTRVLPCGARAFGSPIPLATESPAPVLLTPKTLVFHWPGAPVQTFVATEWGYTRWFAADAFACGANVAQFPQSDPAPPYTLPHAPEDASADPLAPSGVPVSYANAPDSMQDAPARFPLAPATAGLCTTTIADAFGQKATFGVQVMGQIAAGPDTLSWAADDSSPKRVVLGKTWDGDRLNPTLVSSTCAGIATASVGGTPLVPAGVGQAASARAVTITPVMSGGANAGGSCAFTFASQYSGEPPAVVSINIAAGQALQTWPAEVKYAVQGQSFAVGSESCAAQALLTDGATADPHPPHWVADLGIAVDSQGCYNGQLIAHEEFGQTKTFMSQFPPTCSIDVLQPTIWFPSSVATTAALGLAPGDAPGFCDVGLDDGSGASKHYYGGLVKVIVGQNARWVADWTLVWQDGCDQQVGDCRSTRDSGTVGCASPMVRPGGYEIGSVALADITSQGIGYLYSGGSLTSQSIVSSGASYQASSSNIHNDWLASLSIWSCYDANDPRQPVEIQ